MRIQSALAPVLTPPPPPPSPSIPPKPRALAARIVLLPRPPIRVLPSPAARLLRKATRPRVVKNPPPSPPRYNTNGSTTYAAPPAGHIIINKGAYVYFSGSTSNAND